MEIRRLLYVTNRESPDFGEVEGLMALRQLGLEEVIFLNPLGVDDWEGKVVELGLKSRTLEGKGPLLNRILQTARQEAVSMVAASLKRRSGEASKGSFLKNLLRSSPAPVILLRRDVQRPDSLARGVFQHVIYATDWSPASETVLQGLLEFKGVIHMLEIVNVVHKRLSVRELRELRRRLVETRKMFLDKGIDAEAHVYAGKPSEEIMLAAKDYEASCIVMGISRKTPLQKIFSRSCTHDVALKAEIPVMFVGEQEKRSTRVGE